MRALRLFLLLPLLSLVGAAGSSTMACSSDAFVPPTEDAATEAAVADARDEHPLDASADAEAAVPFCASQPTALLCDELERSSLQGPWDAVELLGNGVLSLVPAWSGNALRCTADGAGARAALARTFPGVGSWSLWFDVEVISTAAPVTVAALVTSATETTALEVDETSARLRSVAATQQTAPLGAFAGLRSVVIRRDVATNQLVVRVDGKVAGSLTVTGGTTGPVTVRVGVVEPGASGSIPAELRVDRIAFTP